LGEFNHKLSEELEKHDPVALRKIKEEYGPLRRKNKEDAK
jgi:hypothetical protein